MECYAVNHTADSQIGDAVTSQKYPGGAPVSTNKHSVANPRVGAIKRYQTLAVRVAAAVKKLYDEKLLIGKSFIFDGGYNVPHHFRESHRNHRLFPYPPF